MKKEFDNLSTNIIHYYSPLLLAGRKKWWLIKIKVVDENDFSKIYCHGKIWVKVKYFLKFSLGKKIIKNVLIYLNLYE